MDWNKANDEQIEMLVTSMREVFGNIYSLGNYLSAEKVDFELPHPVWLQPFEEHFPTYVETAIREGFVGRLVKKLREVPQFAQAMDHQRFLELTDWYSDYVKRNAKAKVEVAQSEPVSGKVVVAEPIVEPD